MKLLTRKEVMAILGVGRTALMRYELQEGFPKRRYLSARRSVWKEDEVLAWIESRPRELVQLVERHAKS